MNKSRIENYRRDIDGLRAVAVVSVVLFHAFPHMLPGGFVGVDIFFVISGYLISGILFKELESNSFTYAHFYQRRLRRIFPALIAVLAMTCIAGWFYMSPLDYRRLGKEVVSGGAFLANFALWSETGYFDSDAQSKPLLHLWSLAVEEQFYLLWPFLLTMAWKLRRGLLATTCLTAALSFAVNIATVKLHPAAAFYSPLSRFWELMLGGMLAYRAMRWSEVNDTFGNLRSVIGLLLLAASFTLFSSNTVFPGVAALLPVVGALLLISASPSWINRRVLGSEPLRKIGLVSYPLYLWHWPILYMVSNYQWWSGAGNLIARIIAIAISLVLSVATYKFIECPVRFGSQSRYVPQSLVGAMLILIAAGCIVFWNNGFVARDATRYAQLAQLAGKYPATEWRDQQCFLGPEQSASDFSTDCTQHTGGHVVLLWGDSFAAALYPGLKSLQQSMGFSLFQRTASLCPPYVGIDSPVRRFCPGINAATLRLIAKERPETVILAAHWPFEKFQKNYNIDHLPSTINALRSSGVSNIVIVGPPPEWKRAMPSMLESCASTVYRVKDNEFSRCGLVPGVDDLDHSMRRMVENAGARYISLYDSMCNSKGCLTVIGGKFVSTYDFGHLSPEASRYVMQINAQAISETLRSAPRVP
jgi:peptidoglycan/LPS O-acetylase OafA/YrhL